MRVLLIGPSIERTKGGMATVLAGILSDKGLGSKHSLQFVVSHVEGGIDERLFYILLTIRYILFKRNTYDIMHIHMATKGSFYRKSIFVLLGRMLGKAIILHNHGAELDTFFLKSPALIKRFIRFVFGQCNMVIVLSKSWKSFVLKNIVGKGVEVLNNAVDADYYRECISNTREFKEFLFLGRLGKRKGVYDLLDAIHQITKQDKAKGMRFYLAGDGEISEVKEYIEKHSLSENVIVVGWVGKDSKNDILKRVDTLVLPSYHEGLPMSILEAMASGKVVISTFVGGIPDLVKQNENGFLLEPGDVPNLCKYILKVRDEKSLMNKISENNILKIMNEYDLRQVNKKLSRIYTSVMNY